MSIGEDLSNKVRAALSGTRAVHEVKMFGGIGFMLNGNMVVAASDRGLLIRVGKDGDAEALKRPGASQMIMNGRKMAGYIRIAGPKLDARTVKTWVKLGCAYVQTLPAKEKTKKKSAKTQKPAKAGK